jgi:hypothetical protein
MTPHPNYRHLGLGVERSGKALAWHEQGPGFYSPGPQKQVKNKNP